MPDRQAEDLKAAQQELEAVEAERARSAIDEQESAQHERRADKARYLQEKLQERADSERESERER